MAYSKTPSIDTRSSVKAPAMLSINRRAVLESWLQSSPDEGTVNLLPYFAGQDGKEVWGEARPPILARTFNVSGGGTVRGIYAWEKSIGTVYYFAVAGTSVFTSTNGMTWTAVDTLLTNATTPVGFTEFIDSTNTKKLVLVDGVEGYVYTTNAAGTKITDVDFPTPHVPYPVFIDGYLFLAKSGTGDIYNSDLNDPALWTAGNFISSELYPDDIQAIVKVNNYLLAIGTQGCEYFYDAGNTSGSPLARNEGASLPFGCSLPYSIATNKNTVVFVATTGDGEPVVKKIENFKAEELENNYLIRLLNGVIVGGASPQNVRGYFLRIGGKLYYCLNTDRSAAEGQTYYYCFTTKFWGQLAYNSTTSVSGQLANFPVVCSCPPTSITNTSFVGGNSTQSGRSEGFFGTLGVSNIFTSAVYGSTYTDKIRSSNGGTFPTSAAVIVQIRTPVMTFDTLNSKTMSRIGLHYNFTTNGPTSNTISYYIDEESTARTASLKSETFPFTHQIGRFRKIQILFSATISDPFIAINWEFDINKGRS